MIVPLGKFKPRADPTSPESRRRRSIRAGCNADAIAGQPPKPL
jgi:hypothetical protein